MHLSIISSLLPALLFASSTAGLPPSSPDKLPGPADHEIVVAIQPRYDPETYDAMIRYRRGFLGSRTHEALRPGGKNAVLIADREHVKHFIKYKAAGPEEFTEKVFEGFNLYTIDAFICLAEINDLDPGLVKIGQALVYSDSRIFIPDAQLRYAPDDDHNPMRLRTVVDVPSETVRAWGLPDDDPEVWAKRRQPEKISEVSCMQKRARKTLRQLMANHPLLEPHERVPKKHRG